MNTVNIALCEGRHEMPNGVIGAIYPNTIDPTNLASLDETAKSFVEAHLGEVVNLYVTGLTVALVAVIKACMHVRIGLTLWHFDRATGDYYPQVVQEE